MGSSLSCRPSKNYIMTASIGEYLNANSFYYYSNFSINSFKSLLLTPNMAYVISTNK